jgi:HEAT repeat protein
MSVLTFYCPECWATIPEEYVTCPHCGFDLSQFSRSTYEEKLLKALHHTVQERQLIAAEVLGKIGSQRALPEFEAILDREKENYFLLRAVVEATAKIPDPRRRDILQKTARQHSSSMIQHLAEELLASLPAKEEAIAAAADEEKGGEPESLA